MSPRCLLLLVLFVVVEHSWTLKLRSPRVRSNLFLSAAREIDVLVIGSGVSGLTAAALLAKVGHRVEVVESHDCIGGCAHGWQRAGYSFESGPSLYSGFTQGDSSSNPLYNVFRIIGESPEWMNYDRWGTVLPGLPPFAAKIGPDEFGAVLDKWGGQTARPEWDLLMAELLKPGGVADGAQALSPLLLREDAGAIVTLLRNPQGLMTAVRNGAALNAPFTDIVNRLGLKNEFVLNWLDLLTFLLQGLPSSGTMNAVIGYMMKDWYAPNVSLDFPLGGSGEIVAALARGVTKNGGSIRLNSHVTEIVLENGSAVGVKVRSTRGGVEEEEIRARHVVCSADTATLRKLVPRGASPALDAEMDQTFSETPLLPSFIHLHAGIDASALPRVASEQLPAQWAVVNSWERGVEAPRNVVLVSVPSLLDPSLAPPGKHIIHAYTPATEPYDDWAHLDRGSEAYKQKKLEAASFLWSAVEAYIPNARALSDKRVEQIGTPLTHERFLRRKGGSYGPRLPAGTGSLPAHKTPIKNLLRCGDFTFPGIGIPAAAASGAVAANSIMSLSKHMGMLNSIGM